MSDDPDLTDTDKDPEVVIMYLVGKVLTQQEIHAAFGLSRSGYRKAQEEGRLITPDNLHRVADHFNINYIELLKRFGLIDTETIQDYLKKPLDFLPAPARQTAPAGVELVGVSTHSRSS